jgi:FixJ family two-component response regulator
MWRDKIMGASATGREFKMPSMTHAPPIVFVDDDDVSVRESAAEFLAHPRRSVPSCLLLDVSMPGLNGLDLQKRIANDRTNTPIIFITGHGDIPMTVEAMKAGAVEFLTKPFTDEVLLGAIRPAIERSAKRWAVKESCRRCVTTSHRCPNVSTKSWPW